MARQACNKIQIREVLVEPIIRDYLPVVDVSLNEALINRKRLVELLKTDQFIMRENGDDYLFIIFKDHLEVAGIYDLPSPVSEEIFKVEKVEKDRGKLIKIQAKTLTAIVSYFENLLGLNKKEGSGNERLENN